MQRKEKDSGGKYFRFISKPSSAHTDQMGKMYNIYIVTHVQLVNPRGMLKTTELFELASGFPCDTSRRVYIMSSYLGTWNPMWATR